MIHVRICGRGGDADHVQCDSEMGHLGAHVGRLGQRVIAWREGGWITIGSKRAKKRK